MVDRPLTNFQSINGLMLPHSARNLFTCDVKINWLHPLARGLKMCIIPITGGFIDVVRQGTRFLSGGTTVFNNQGFGIGTSKTRQQFGPPQGAALADLDFTTNGWSLAFLADGGQQGALGHINDTITSGSNAGIEVLATGTNAAAVLVMNNSADAAHWQLTAANNTLPTSGPYTQAATGDGTTVRLYVNAASVATSTSMTQLPKACQVAGQLVDLDGNCSIGCFWDHTLSVDELMLFHKQPFGMLQKGMDADMFPYAADFKTTFRAWATD